MDDRAVSSVLSYALSLTIVTILIAGVFTSMGGFVEDQRERAIRAEFEVLGNRLAADIAAVDRMAIAANGSGSAWISTNLPSSVAGKPYTINVSDPGSGPYEIELHTSDPEIAVTVNVKTETTLTPSRVTGGAVRIAWNGTALEVERA